MSGTILHFPNTPSWCGTKLKESAGTTLPLPFTAALFIRKRNQNLMPIHVSMNNFSGIY